MSEIETQEIDVLNESQLKMNLLGAFIEMVEFKQAGDIESAAPAGGAFTAYCEVLGLDVQQTLETLLEDELPWTEEQE